MYIYDEDMKKRYTIDHEYIQVLKKKDEIWLDFLMNIMVVIQVMSNSPFM